MGKQSQNKFAKRQKEIERKRKADEKMARRHEKKTGKLTESDAPFPDRTEPALPDSPQQPSDSPPPADGPQGATEFRHEAEV